MRRQSVAATALWIKEPMTFRIAHGYLMESGVALRLPPHSKAATAFRAARVYSTCNSLTLRKWCPKIDSVTATCNSSGRRNCVHKISFQ